MKTILTNTSIKVLWRQLWRAKMRKTVTKTMAESGKKLVIQNKRIIDENLLFERVSAIIESRKKNAAAYANREITLMYWEVGRFVNSIILDFKRADYGKKILTTLSTKLVETYGKSFSEANIYRMLRCFFQSDCFFAELPLSSEKKQIELRECPG